MTLASLLNPTELGPVVATLTMDRVRADSLEEAVIEPLTISIGIPQNYTTDEGLNVWISTLQITILPSFYAMVGESSLDAVINATYLAQKLLSVSPYASEIEMYRAPYFGLPINPITTTPEALAAEQAAAATRELQIVTRPTGGGGPAPGGDDPGSGGSNGSGGGGGGTGGGGGAPTDL